MYNNSDYPNDCKNYRINNQIEKLKPEAVYPKKKNRYQSKDVCNYKQYRIFFSEFLPGFKCDYEKEHICY